MLLPTARVQLKQLMFSCCKDVVHILPIAKIDTKALHEFLKKLITDLEVVVFTNSINRKAIKFFANLPKQALCISIQLIHLDHYFTF